jgi:hypothetical protein
MAISCTPSSLAESAKCFCGIAQDKTLARAVELYLSCLIAGVDPDPDALVTLAKCFCGIAQNDEQYKSVMTYLTCTAANVT